MQMQPINERRQQRSSDPHQALLLQLSHVRDGAGLSALVLATDDGLPIAHAGDANICCELAAVAPLLSRGECVHNDVHITHDLLCVRAVQFEGTSLYLASCGETFSDDRAVEIDRWLAEATRGVTRILAS